ncbi:unnamed protein product [Mytilus coruscus]|uniref:L-Fucosyltransferase n=1 Tax=Mytilus coruscus TaxID=42192 RepID=A0A6J8ALR6_MYTCO|nr:unnamed protein product [Mytilus coruscus]
MGNHIFQFAATLGIARSKGIIHVITEYFSLRKIFKLTVSVVPVNSGISDSGRVITRVEQKPSSYDKELVNLTNSHDVASDGIDWTKNNMPNHITVAYLEGHSPEVDMATVSMCDHFIATVGTLSWWCGWLTGDNVLYYKWPCEEGSLVRAMYSSNYTDFYYPHWIGL